MKNIIKIGIIDRDDLVRSETRRAITENVSSDNSMSIDIVFDQQEAHEPKHLMIPVLDVLLFDIAGQDVRAVGQAKITYPHAQIIILTNISDMRAVRRCFRSGAVGYLLKQTCMQSLTAAIRITFEGGSFISPSINRAMIDRVLTTKKSEDMLTARELQIANGIVEGMSYKMIAQQYTLSLDTVRIYIKRVYRKLNINSKGQLIAQLSG